MKKKTIWNFTYKGIECEVVNWRFNSVDDYFEREYPTGNWNGYIYINKKQLPRSFNKLLCEQKDYRFGKTSPARKHWDYYKLEDYFDFHGGITYYELIRDQFTGESWGIKIGCDYMHLGDGGRIYNENDIRHDLESSVDKFIDNFPNYLVWDQRDGKYRKFLDTQSSQHKEREDMK